MSIVIPRHRRHRSTIAHPVLCAALPGEGTRIGGLEQLPYWERQLTDTEEGSNGP